MFLEAELAKVMFLEAELAEVVFLEAELGKVVFLEAVLVKVVFLEAVVRSEDWWCSPLPVGGWQGRYLQRGWMEGQLCLITEDMRM